MRDSKSFQRFQFRRLPCFATATGLALLGIVSVARGQDVCDEPPAGNPHLFRTAIRGGTLSGDPFGCGPSISPTPGTCTLYNRVFTDQESSCVNREQGVTPPDYLPQAYGPSLQNYELDLITVGNWAGELGVSFPVAKRWFALWDHIVNPAQPEYVGYYAAQSDLVALGEAGNPRADPCTQDFIAISCAPLVKAALASSCVPLNTPLGPLSNLGGLAPVPVPYLLAFLGDPAFGFSDPNSRIALEWITPCAQTQGADTAGSGSMAPEPIMGFRLEAFVDRNGNSAVDTAPGSGWDPALRDVNGGCQPGLFHPLVDIAPFWGDVFGSRLTRRTVIDIADFTGIGQPFETPGQIEALTFRLRLLYRDDRYAETVGGLDAQIDPVCSAPSAMGSPIANPQLFGSAAGAVPDGDLLPGVPLAVSHEANGDVTLTWGSSCNSNDSDYAIYEGVYGNPTGYLPRFCSTGGATTKTFTPATGSAFFIVVPRNTQVEGSYGVDSGGGERPPSGSACAPQNFSCQEGGDLLPPVAITGPVIGIGSEAATLTGDVNPNEFDTSAFFEWGTDTSYGSSTPTEFVDNGAMTVPFSAVLSGLTSDTTYHYRLVATNPLGTTLGDDASFTTGLQLAPTVTTLAASGVNHESAFLNADVNPNGFDTSVHFEWGLTTAYGHLTPTTPVGAGTSVQLVTKPIAGLLPNTVYHFRAVGTNSIGMSYGQDRSFLTTPVPTELLVNGSFTDRTIGWSRSGDLLVFTNSPVEYRTPPGYAAGGVDSSGDPIDDASGRLYQDVAIPAGANAATVTFWYNITTQEGGGASDFLRVTVRDLQDNLLIPVVNLDNTYNSALGDYLFFSFDLSFYIGQTIRLDFEIESDGADPTVFRFDDVSLFLD